MSAASMTPLEEELAGAASRRYCRLVGTATVAIYLALRALGVRGGKVVVPALVCPAVANAVVYAGFEPVFCEVSRHTFNLDTVELERLVRQLPDVVAVIPVHLYGHPAPMSEVSRVAGARGIAVIEDAAQAQGATCSGKPVGSFGNMSVLSFGHTKIIDAGGGGAVLTDDEAMHERISEDLHILPPPPENLDELTAEYRRVYYALKPLADGSTRLNPLFFPLPPIFRAMHLYAATPEMSERIANGMSKIGGIVDHRRMLAERYTDRLQHSDIELRAESDPGAVPWRFSFLITNERTKAICESLRTENIPVSNWYPPVHRWYPQSADATLPQADFVGAHVVNLWVEPATTVKDVDRTTEALLKRLDSVHSLS